MVAARSAERRRTRARRGEGDKLRTEILAAAERLLAQTSDESAVSVRAVADAVGVTAPFIYLHFADKSEHLVAVCERNFDELSFEVERAASRAAEGPRSFRRRASSWRRCCFLRGR